MRCVFYNSYYCYFVVITQLSSLVVAVAIPAIIIVSVVTVMFVDDGDYCYDYGDCGDDYGGDYCRPRQAHCQRH